MFDYYMPIQISTFGFCETKPTTQVFTVAFFVWIVTLVDLFSSLAGNFDLKIMEMDVDWDGIARGQ